MAFQSSSAVGSSNIPKGRLLIWLIVAGEIPIFGTGVIAYLIYRFRYPDIYDALASLTSTPLGSLNTMILLTSSFFVVRAHHYAAQKELKKVERSLWITVSLGILFLWIKSIEWIPKISHGIVLGKLDPDWGFGPGQNFWWFYYFLTGMHAFHIVIGIVAILIIIFNDISREKNIHRVEIAGIYWHFVDLIWIFLFPLLYLSR